MAKINLKISANYAKRKMTLALTQERKTVAAITVDVRDAARIAGNILQTAAKVDELNEAEPRYKTKDDAVELTVVRPSAHNVGPGRTPKSTMMIFPFGETVLGIELPNEDARILGRRLMTSAADEGTTQ
jgi:hypothetical protein